MTHQRSEPRRRLGRAIVIVSGLVLIVLIALGVRTFGGEVRQLANDVVHLGTPSTDGTPLDPSAFASGACMSFPPTDGNNGKTVFLDAGHGGLDPGGVGTTESGQTVYESNVNLAIELDAMAILRADGYRVVVSRTADTTVVEIGPGGHGRPAPLPPRLP